MIWNPFRRRTSRAGLILSLMSSLSKLTRARLKNLSSWRWSDSERMKEIDSFYNLLTSAIKYAESFNGGLDDNESLDEEVRSKLERLNERLRDLRYVLEQIKSYCQDEKGVSGVNVESLTPAEEFNKELDQLVPDVQELLKLLDQPESQSRRNILIKSSKVVVGLAAGAILAKFGLDLFNHKIEPGYLYIQLNAFSTYEHCEAYAKSQNKFGVVVFSSRNRDVAPFKALLEKKFLSYEDVIAAYDKIKSHLPKTVGIILVNKDLTTSWVKTIEDLIVGVAQQKPPTSISTKGTMEYMTLIKKFLKERKRPFHESEIKMIISVVRSAVERYPLKRRKRISYVVTEGRRAVGTRNLTMEQLVHAIIHVESEYVVRARSKSDARGVMQLRSRTFNALHRGKEKTLKDSSGKKVNIVEYGSALFYHKDVKKLIRRKWWVPTPSFVMGEKLCRSCDRYDVEQNVDAGVHLLQYLLDRYSDRPLRDVIQMYNYGEAGVLSGEADKKKEPREYPGKVLKEAKLMDEHSL